MPTRRTRRRLPRLLIGLTFTLSPVALAADDTAEFANGPATTQAALVVEIDTRQAPDLKEFGDRCVAACKKMFPVFCEDLASDGFVSPDKVTIIFDPNYKGVAATGGTKISCSPEYFRHHKDDVGALVHELVHVVQSYPKYDPVWLVEGIADYERFYRYEPAGKRPHPTARNANYQEGYQTAAAFLNWAQKKYDAALVKKLNTACRETRDTHEVFEKSTGRSLDALWNEFAATLPSNPANRRNTNSPTTKHS